MGILLGTATTLEIAAGNAYDSQRIRALDTTLFAAIHSESTEDDRGCSNLSRP